MASTKTISFTFEKETKNTLRFTEDVPTSLDTPAIGTLYVQKQTLKDLGYQSGQKLQVSLEAK
jgi:hypothetical protein